MSHNGDYWVTSNSSISDGPLEKLGGGGEGLETFKPHEFFTLTFPL